MLHPYSIHYACPVQLQLEAPHFPAPKSATPPTPLRSEYNRDTPGVPWGASGYPRTNPEYPGDTPGTPLGHFTGGCGCQDVTSCLATFRLDVRSPILGATIASTGVKLVVGCIALILELPSTIPPPPFAARRPPPPPAPPQYLAAPHTTACVLARTLIFWGKLWILHNLSGSAAGGVSSPPRRSVLVTTELLS
jgi:hypothetical protein